MSFKEEIIKLENQTEKQIYIFNNGQIPILLTAVHTMEQELSEYLKFRETFTKAIAKYVGNHTNAFYFLKVKDTNIDANTHELEEYKQELLKIIDEYNIQLVIDLHGAKESREFAIEFGTLNNLSADFSTIRELEDAFNQNGITNIVHNDPFKGGGITRQIYSNTNIDVIQLEINQKYRDIENPDRIEKVCNSLIDFINQYQSYLRNR